MCPADLEILALELATGAAAEIRSLRRGEVSAKSTDTDLVTDTDRAAERWLRERLARERPDDAILGEETGGRAGTSGMRWLLDPIDGTVNFVLGLPQYAVSVAVEAISGDGAGRTLAGAVCNPVSGETFSAHLGGGARRDGVPLTQRRQVPLHRAVIGTGFSYDATVRGAQAAVLAGLLPQIADVRRMGAASLDLCAVAAGRLDGYYEAGLHPWDYAAGALIAAEAGAIVSGLGRPAPGTGMVVAAAPGIARDLVAALRQLRADEVSSRGSLRS